MSTTLLRRVNMAALSLAVLVGTLLVTTPAKAEGFDGVVQLVRPAPSSRKTEEPPKWIRYTSSGLRIGSEDHAVSAKVHVRSQLRFSSPFLSPPSHEGHLDRIEEVDFRFRRARFKMDGHVAAPWIKYKYEHDLVDGRLLDLRFDVGPEWMKVRVGQWKADYSRERMDSSGKQQLVERSIVNRQFTIDREKGVELLGRVGKGSAADSQYFVGVFTGQGRGVFRDRRVERDAEDGSPMWLARYQWNALGGGVALSQSDLERQSEPRLSLAVATTRNRSSYTRFSSGGGGDLDGFEPGLPGQYSIRQYLVEAAFKQKGFSYQQEFHWKRVIDNVNARTTNMRASYIHAGYFFNEIYSRIPRQLELAGRYAFVDPQTSRTHNIFHERAVVANWFFNGHGDKLSIDVSRYSLMTEREGRRSKVGVRVQWDASF